MKTKTPSLTFYKIGTLALGLYKKYGRGVVVYEQGKAMLYAHPSLYTPPKSVFIDTYNPVKEFCIDHIITQDGLGMFAVGDLNGAWGKLRIASIFPSKFEVIKNIRIVGF